MSWSNFIKIKKIGEGSFGAAWLVKSNQDNIHYVIKLINVARMPTKERDEARKEVSVLAQMKHPNIVSYIDSFEESGNLCIVMDYCDGGDLYSKIHSTRGVHFSEEQILDWFVQITLALKHVHDRKILHRDLKSQNIFLTKDGSVKLGDFGVAKVLTNTMDFARTAIGTPYYMSPELVEHKPYNNKSDVWSLGCVLYELVSMRHPFEANNMQMLAYKILRGNFDPISPKFSYELRNLVTSMLKRNPRERPSVNGILRKAFIMKRCEKFLTNEKLLEEFSHTILHGENFAHKIQNINKPTPRLAAAPSPRPISAISLAQAKPPAVAPLKAAYDPSKIYGAPIVRRANPAAAQQLKKSIEKRNLAFLELKKKQAASPRPPSVDYSENDRKSPYSDQLKNKRAFEEALLKKKHQEIAERQKQERLKKARDEGWQNVLMSDSFKDNKEEMKQEKNPYANRHQQIDDFIERRKIIEKQIESPSILKPSPPPIISRQNSNNRKPMKSAFSNEYKRRKEEFERNRARGKGINNNILVAKPPILKKDEKSVYEENLRKIRLKNYNNRKSFNVNTKSEPETNDKKEDELHNARIDRISALKLQAEEQRLKLRNELERKRIDSFEKERKYEVDKPLNEFKSPRLQPAPAVNLTEVFNAIGVVGKQISKAEVLKNPNDEVINRNIRKSWQKGTDLTPLNDKTLVQPTLKNNLYKYRPQVSPRKAWDLPHETILKAFELISISNSANSSGESNKTEFNNQTLLANEKEPDLLFGKSKLLFSPEKLATLKATKNLLLGVTLGQFDSKNTKMLRTCSEPDMLKMFPLTESENDQIPEQTVKQQENDNKTTKRLVKSLEDIQDQVKPEENEEDSNSDDKKDDKEFIELYESTIKSELDESKSSDEDVTEVRETMELLLIDSDEEIKKTQILNKPKNKVCFAASKDLVSAVSVSNYDFTADSLETKSTINDDQDLEEVSINGESDSDTEFEDDIVMPITVKEPFSSCVAEEQRDSLEKNLGADEFIKAYPQIEKLILKEIKSETKSKRPFELFKQLFPNVDEKLYEQFHKLILSDNDIYL